MNKVVKVKRGRGRPRKNQEGNVYPATAVRVAADEYRNKGAATKSKPQQLLMEEYLVTDDVMKRRGEGCFTFGSSVPMTPREVKAAHDMFTLLMRRKDAHVAAGDAYSEMLRLTWESLEKSGIIDPKRYTYKWDYETKELIVINVMLEPHKKA